MFATRGKTTLFYLAYLQISAYLINFSMPTFHNRLLSKRRRPIERPGLGGPFASQLAHSVMGAPYFCTLTVNRYSFELTEAVESVFDMLYEHARVKGIEVSAFVHPQCPRTVVGDAARLRQVCGATGDRLATRQKPNLKKVGDRDTYYL